MSERQLCVVSVTAFFGGGEQYLIRLAALLRGHAKVVVLSPPLPNFESQIVAQGARFVALPGGAAVRRAAAVRWLARHRDAWREPDAAVLLNGRGAAFLLPALRALGLSPAMVAHTIPTGARTAFKERVFGLLTRRSPCVIAVSRATADAHRAAFPWLRIETVPLWFDDPSTRENMHRRADASHDAPYRIALLGRLVREKGVADALAAMQRLDASARAEIHVFGDGPMAAELQQDFGAVPGVRLRGHVEDAANLLPEFDILLSASYSEAASTSVSEGMQAGRVVVASDIPAHRELLGPDYPAELFFAAGDVTGLTQALTAALHLCEPGAALRRAQLVQDMHRRIRERHSPDGARARYLSVLWGHRR